MERTGDGILKFISKEWIAVVCIAHSHEEGIPISTLYFSGEWGYHGRVHIVCLDGQGLELCYRIQNILSS